MPIDALSRKLSNFVSLTSEDRAVLEKTLRHRKQIGADADLRVLGGNPRQILVLNQGWTCSYKVLPDGSRQIVSFQLPGDFLGLRRAPASVGDLNIVAITKIEAIVLNEADIVRLFFDEVRIADGLQYCAAVDEAIVVEHLINLGRRTADVRMAHLLLELHERLRKLGEAESPGFDCPLTQYHLADALGLSAVHVNRVLRHLREAGLLRFHKGRVVFENALELKRFAGFDPSYLTPNPATWNMALNGNRAMDPIRFAAPREARS